MAIDALDVHITAARAPALLERRTTCRLHRTRRHPGHARGGSRSRRTDARGRAGGQSHIVGAELEPGDVQDHVAHALADFRSGAMHLCRAVVRENDPRGAVVVEALRVADVLEAHCEAEAASHALAARGVSGTAW